MCLFCKSEVNQTRHEAYPTYSCTNCGIYIIPESQLLRVREKASKIDPKELRNKSEQEKPLFFGTAKNFQEYQEFLSRKNCGPTKSKFIDIETL